MITAKVKHSQRLSVPPVKTWAAAEKGGAVVCAHCDCMAGLGEACSHIAAILFTLDANVQARKSLSCTSVPCSWLPPTFKNVPFAPISDINFADPEKRLKAMVGTSSSSKCFVNSACEGEGTSSSSKTLTNLTSSKSEAEHFFRKLSDPLVKNQSKCYLSLSTLMFIYMCHFIKKDHFQSLLLIIMRTSTKNSIFLIFWLSVKYFFSRKRKRTFKYLTRFRVI